MEDKDLKRQQYLEFMKEQRRLEREMQKIDKEEWDIVSSKAKTTREYQKLPEAPPIKLVLLSEEETKVRDKKKKVVSQPLHEVERKRAPRKYDGDYADRNRQRNREKSRRYYQNNKEEALAKHAAWYEKNREKQREYHREYQKRKREAQQLAEAQKFYKIITPDMPSNEDWHLRNPSQFRNVITSNGCNTCGSQAPVYTFKNDNGDYTGCLCQACLNTYKHAENKESGWLLKVRDYIRNKQREAHEQPPTT